MIQTIKQHPKLKRFVHYDIEDAGFRVEVDFQLTDQDYIGIKIDDYYNSLKLSGETPKSVDFIVSVDCDCDAYVLYVIEFKDTKSYTGNEIWDKFNTTINRFMAEEFKDVFMNDKFKYKDIKLYLVTTANKTALKYSNYQQYITIHNKVHGKDTLMSDLMLSGKPFFFRGKYLYINREIPPNPIIKKVS